uniref:ATP-grasp domain-containing protein n=1 Tax=Wuchereria bancrofti TaxID=6293 RepID=A0AAF5PTX3_WUCBA
MTTLIIVLWRHRLNFHGYCKQTTDPSFRVVVVGPENSINDDTCVDVHYQIQPAFGSPNHCHALLIEKVRELVSNYGLTRRIIVTFEAELQYLMAKIRFELGIEGLLPDHVEQVVHMKEMKLIARRNGLMTLRHVDFVFLFTNSISMQTIIPLKAEPSLWLRRIATQLDGFPVFIRSCEAKHGRKITRYSIHDCDEMQSWIKSKLEVENKHDREFIVEECLRNGYEFVSLYSNSGFICTIARMSAEGTLFESIRDQKPYAYEYLTVDQTRDILPGVESFVLRTAKSLPVIPNSSFVFIKGFYKNHNDIYLLGTYLQPLCDSHRRLIEAANHGVGWEILLLNCMEEVLQTVNQPHDMQKSIENHHVLVNFPSIEGVLLHQTSITKRNSNMRVIWKACEGQVLTSCTSSDDNILQIFLSNPNRAEVIADARDLIENTYIAVDRSTDKHNFCNDIRAKKGCNHFIRSMTTCD